MAGRGRHPPRAACAVLPHLGRARAAAADARGLGCRGHAARGADRDPVEPLGLRNRRAVCGRRGGGRGLAHPPGGAAPNHRDGRRAAQGVHACRRFEGGAQRQHQHGRRKRQGGAARAPRQRGGVFHREQGQDAPVHRGDPGGVRARNGNDFQRPHGGGHGARRHGRRGLGAGAPGRGERRPALRPQGHRPGRQSVRRHGGRVRPEVDRRRPRRRACLEAGKNRVRPCSALRGPGALLPLPRAPDHGDPGRRGGATQRDIQSRRSRRILRADRNRAGSERNARPQRLGAREPAHGTRGFRISLISRRSPFAGGVAAVIRRLLLGIGALIPAALLAEPVNFNLPAQPADGALLAFCKQANVEMLFPYDKLHKVTSADVTGRMEPEDALERLLKGTGFEARRNGRGKYVVRPVAQATGSIRGRLVTPAGAAAPGIHVVIPSLRLAGVTNGAGTFAFPAVPPGTYQLFAAGAGLPALQIDGVRVTAGEVLTLEALTMSTASDPARLQPYVGEGKSALSSFPDDSGPPPAPRVAIGDVDLARSENDALDYTIFTRDQIARSGVTNLSEFLRNELLQSDATTLPPDQNGIISSFVSASSNINLGGFPSSQDATIVLVDGRRLPEIVTALPGNNQTASAPPQPDVNVIPINLIERVEVLPVSASAIYSGSPVGGVINIVLRPDVNATELTTTYTNALGRFDAPQSTTSLLHGETLLGGALRVLFNATFTQATPPTESNLGYIRANVLAHPVPEGDLYRATPNVSSANASPLFGPGTASITSVAPGSDGSGGITSFADRQGVQSVALYVPPGGGLADTPNSLDYPYGRKEQGIALFGSVLYDVFPWLQVGVDASAGRTVNNTGYSVFAGNLVLPADSPFNPFHQAVNVTLNETAPGLGENYDEAHIEYYSAVFGLLLKMRDGWQASLDAQYGLSVTTYRGLEGVDNNRWQQLVGQGVYNPLRDTQVYGPPQQFYDQALVFYGAKGRFVTLGDYDTFDSALRFTDPSLRLPTGSATVTFGGDYRLARLGRHVDRLPPRGGTRRAPPRPRGGRTLQRISAFGELQAPLLPAKWLPRWITGIETDLAARYTASDIAN